ncbi:MAG: ChrR family anti-sigma-E factor [Parvibaculum sp.]
MTNVPHTPQHLLGDEWVMAYAAGTLSEGAALMVASHLSFRPDAQRQIAAAEAVGGALLDGMTPETLADDALSRTLAMLDTPEGPRPQKPATPLSDTLPAPLREWLGRDVNDLPWSFLGPGMKKVKLWRGPNDERLWMLRAQPGVAIPRHGHNGSELTLVLKGSFSDPSGTYRRGDVEEKDDSDSHGLTIGPGEECICLALTNGPIRFESLAARLLQPFIGL